MNLDKPIFSSNLAGLFLRVPIGIYFFLSGRLFLHQPDSLVQVISEFQIFPESETKFFLKVVDAQIEFIESENGSFESFMLYQGGHEIPGKKKN